MGGAGRADPLLVHSAAGQGYPVKMLPWSALFRFLSICLRRSSRLHPQRVDRGPGRSLGAASARIPLLVGPSLVPTPASILFSSLLRFASPSSGPACASPLRPNLATGKRIWWDDRTAMRSHSRHHIHKLHLNRISVLGDEARDIEFKFYHRMQGSQEKNTDDLRISPDALLGLNRIPIRLAAQLAKLAPKTPSTTALRARMGESVSGGGLNR